MYVVIDADDVATPPPKSMPLSHFGNCYHHLLICLGYPAAAPPLGALLARYHKLDGRWLVVSPVQWDASHNDAHIIAVGERLAFTDTTAHDAFGLFSEFAKAEGMETYYHDRYIWLLKVKDEPYLSAKPVISFWGQSLLPELQAMDASLFWQRFLTASQMFFYPYKQRLIGMNGIWVWGDGQLNRPITQELVCLDSELEPLMRCFGIPWHANVDKHLSPLCVIFAKQAPVIPQVKQPIDWYWNNHAYRTKPAGWLRRILWRNES